jgi:WS/DGAT/MGAT family acyltransferase
MKQLTSLDAQFLNVESSTTTGHVGALLALDPSTAPGGELTLESVRDLMEQRLHLCPTFRQRLIEVPLGLGLPYWVDDPDFDLEYHLRDVALPAPGDEQQLGEQVARIHSRPLDRSRPLWEMYLIHGLEATEPRCTTRSTTPRSTVSAVARSWRPCSTPPSSHARSVYRTTTGRRSSCPALPR